MATPSCKWSLSGLEGGLWSPQVGPSINPTPPTSFTPEQIPGELIISCAGPKYAGALAKNVLQLPWQSKFVTFAYDLKFDDTIAFGQVAETDMKITDAAGWTYDGSFQWNVVNKWMAQINNPWVDTSVQLPFVQDVWNTVLVQYLLDYAAHTIQVSAVNGKQIALAPIPAKQVGWTPSQLITQLQLCTASQGGSYTLRFQNIGYQGSDS